jgi:trimethylamine:corrinoid methyltransferase-like protein
MGLDQWIQAGRPDVTLKARERWQQLVADHEDPPLEASTARQLKAYVEKEAV